MGSNAGGGSDAQLQEQRRITAEQDSAIRALNQIFGVGDSNALVDRSQFATYKTPLTGALGRSLGKMGMSRPMASETSFDQSGYDSALAAKTAELAGVKAQRESNYETAGQDILNFKTPQLDKQREKAERNLRFQLARTGQTGGSLAQDQKYELNDNYSRGLADLTNQKEAAVNTARAADEQTRIDLINRIRSGMDQASAVASANAQTTSNIDSARDSALGQSLQDYFSGMGYLYGQNQQQQAYNNRLKQLTQGTATADNGTITRT